MKAGNIRIAEGRQESIANVFTEPEWRRRGIAELLLKEIVAWSREQTLDDLVLHAPDDDRNLYEQLGFVLTNKMRLQATESQPDSRHGIAGSQPPTA